MPRLRLTAWGLLVALSVGQGQAEPGAATAPARVSVQIDNPIRNTVIKVSLDGQTIFEGAPQASNAPNIPLLTSMAGSHWLTPANHTLDAEVIGQGIKASLQWRPVSGTDTWVVIHHVSVVPGSAQPPYLRFSLQPRPYKLR